MKLCDYGCGQEAKYPLKNGKWCCSIHWKKCPVQRERNSIQMKGKNTHSRSEETKRKISEAKMGHILSEETKRKISEAKMGKKKGACSEETKRKISETKKGQIPSIETKKKISISSKLTIEQIKEKYLFFSKIEEMRYNPDKLDEKEIQAHCKNHNCENSKEKGGWFTPKYEQLRSRKDHLENIDGNGGSYLYCSQYCKDTCPLYNLRSDPYEDNTKPYTLTELDTLNQLVLKRDNEICYYCSEHTATIVHHLRPQKLEPFFALDPDYAVSVCKKCHYEKGHPAGSEHSTGNLAKIVCSVESQKFLNQTLEDI
jgi:hypothetical protein